MYGNFTVAGGSVNDDHRTALIIVNNLTGENKREARSKKLLMELATLVPVTSLS